MVSAGHLGGTHGSCITSSAADVLWMIVVRGMRGVGGVCEMYMCLDRAERGEWMRGLGFTNPVGTGRLLDVCLCLGCRGMFGVGVEWVGAWARVWRDGVVL